MEKTLRLTQDDISLILNALSAGPYATVAPLINKISIQSNGELNGTNTPTGDTAGNRNPDRGVNGDNLEGSKEHNKGSVGRIPKA